MPFSAERVCATVGEETVVVEIEGTAFGCSVPDARCDPGPAIVTRRCIRRCGAGVDPFVMTVTCVLGGPTLAMDGRTVLTFDGFETCAVWTDETWVEEE